MTTNMKNQILEAVEELGGANCIYDEISAFSERVERLEAKRQQLTEEYPDKWVAMADSEIVAVGDTLKEVLHEIDERGIPRAQVVVDFMDTNPQGLIL